MFVCNSQSSRALSLLCHFAYPRSHPNFFRFSIFTAIFSSALFFYATILLLLICSCCFSSACVRVRKFPRGHQLGSLRKLLCQRLSHNGSSQTNDDIKAKYFKHKEIENRSECIYLLCNLKSQIELNCIEEKVEEEQFLA